MTKSRQSSRNSGKSGLLLISAFLAVSILGCSADIKPTYQEKDIPFLVQKICKDEYGLDVTTRRTHTTIWIYAPVEKILHKDYGVKEDKIFDDDISEKLRNILTTIGRVLISSDNSPEFYVLQTSDINLGIDYTMIGSTLDTKKAYAGFLPWTESNRRYVIKFKLAPEAVGDKTGKHVRHYDITMAEFLTDQIAQRVGAAFQEENMKKYFEVKKSEGQFQDKSFRFVYAIKQTGNPPHPVTIRRKIIEIATYCIQTYEFKDFDSIEFVDELSNDALLLNRGAIWARPKD
ncbi:MAG TPA: hypothetical protein PKL77_04550 [Candidatus Omnitrophota bacterium]|nr:hypothetical protein [Candidatus Omnitrophota bacterium]HPT07433.1 hypothetical protein [Candidatus Omnitrophota bacterium]